MDAAVEELIWQTRRLFRALATIADAELAPLGLEASERALIEFLAREGKPVSISRLARRRSVSRQHVHQTLGRLKNPAWITRTTDPDDARSLLLSLSEEGEKLWSEIRAVDKKVLRRIAREVSPSAVANATRTLRRIRESLEEVQR
jgi:DNA-binding MarR family transcriptional regulator